MNNNNILQNYNSYISQLLHSQLSPIYAPPPNISDFEDYDYDYNQWLHYGDYWVKPDGSISLEPPVAPPVDNPKDPLEWYLTDYFQGGGGGYSTEKNYDKKGVDKHYNPDTFWGPDPYAGQVGSLGSLGTILQGLGNLGINLFSGNIPGVVSGAKTLVGGVKSARQEATKTEKPQTTEKPKNTSGYGDSTSSTGSSSSGNDSGSSGGYEKESKSDGGKKK